VLLCFCGTFEIEGTRCEVCSILCTSMFLRKRNMPDLRTVTLSKRGSERRKRTCVKSVSRGTVWTSPCWWNGAWHATRRHPIFVHCMCGSHLSASSDPSFFSVTFLRFLLFLTELLKSMPRLANKSERPFSRSFSRNFRPNRLSKSQIS